MKKRRAVEAADSQESVEKPPPFLPPCKVCGAVATGLHFGVYTCEACKAFFRRTLLIDRKYKCTKDGNCTISSKRRGTCSACRLNKCLQLGMSKDAVKFGRYTVAQKTKTITEVRKIKGKEEILTTKPSKERSSQKEGIMDIDKRLSESRMEMSTSSNSLSSRPEPLPTVTSTTSEDIVEPKRKFQKTSSSLTLSPYEDKEVEDMMQKIITAHESIYPWMRQFLNPEYMSERYLEVYEEHKLRNAMFGNLTPLPSEEYQKIYQETGLDIDNRQEILQKTGNHVERGIQRYVSFIKCLPGVKELPMTDVIKLIKASRHEFWFLGHYQKMDIKLGVVGAAGELRLHLNDLQKLAPDDILHAEMKLAESLKRLKLSVEEVALLRAIVFMSKDRCDLEHGEKVEQLQMKYVACLEHTLQKFYDNPKQRLSALLDRLAPIRELTELSLKYNKTFISDWDLDKKFPLWTELLSVDDT
ncbi:hypothetical protein ACJMK2_007716 [Sinanodonta woodiana]|uniref:Uncharacterized protein n=1 Tax=Sinanodonta woodiana TaxID=1069815 RepID=A0ABD3VJC8_SINWO